MLHNNSGIFIISSDIVFEVEAYKYKAVSQLIKTLPADCWIHSFIIARRMSQPAATDQGVRSVSSTFHHFHDQKWRKEKSVKSDGADGRCGYTKEPSLD